MKTQFVIPCKSRQMRVKSLELETVEAMKACVRSLAAACKKYAEETLNKASEADLS